MFPAGYWPWPSTVGPNYETEERSPIPPYVPEKPKVDPRFPHDCTSPGCGSKAYVSAFFIECLSYKCQHYYKKGK